MSGGRYAAFLSYSQADEALAVWLQRGLESFRVPEALEGFEGPHGPIGKRLGEIYLHNVENGLGAEARGALERSDALVVLRPAEAARLDAREEVRHYAGLGRTRIISAVIGEPPRGAQPIVWRKLVDEGGQPAAPSEGGAVVDFRAETKAQREGAKLKLIATLLDVDIEELEERPGPPLPPMPKLPSVSPHTAGVAAGAMAVLLVVGGAAWMVSTTPPGAPSAQSARAGAETEIAAVAEQPADAAARLAPPQTRPPAETTAPPPALAASAPPAPRPAAPAARPPSQVATARPAPAQPAARPPAQVATARPAPAQPAARPPAQVATARPAPAQPAARPPAQVATARPAPAQPAARPPAQVATARPAPAQPAARPPAQVAAAPAQTPSAVAIAPPPTQVAQQAPPAARPAVERVAVLADQLRELGAAHSLAIRCLGRSSQESRLRARHLIASSPETSRADLIRAFNEGYTAAEERGGDCPGVQPTSG
jgi:predicted secreted protein